MRMRDVGETKSGPIESYQGFLVRFYNKKIERTKPILTPLIFTFILLSVFSISTGGPALSEEIEIEIESAAVLTLQDAVSIAIAENPEIENASLEVSKAVDDIAAAKTKLLPEFDFSVYELYHLTEEAFTFKKGEFGDFPSTGPIPPENVKIRTAPNFTTYLTASVGQPLSQLYEISLLVKQLRLERDLCDQAPRAPRRPRRGGVGRGAAGGQATAGRTESKLSTKAFATLLSATPPLTRLGQSGGQQRG